MPFKHLCKKIIAGISSDNLKSILCPSKMPAPRKAVISRNQQGMGDFVPGLVSFIIPTMHRSKTESFERLTQPLYTLREVLRDLHTNVTVPFEVVVVCNELKKESFIRFVKSSPHITRYCLNSENVGVPRAWNIGAQMALGEYLCFVNDDVEIGPGATEAMVESFKSYPEAGMVGPAGARWHRQTPGEAVGLTKMEKADAIGGWLFMTPQRVFTAVGGFDEAYTPALMEEIDFAFAVRDRGYSCLVIPGLKAIHHHVHGASSSTRPLTALGFSLERDDLTARNRAYFESKWSKFWKESR